MNDWGLLQSLSSWLCVTVAIFIALIFYLEKKVALIQSELTKSSPRLPRSRILLPLLICALLVVALLRPYVGKETIMINSSAYSDVFLVIDVSISMLAQDASPSRIEFAKRKARDIVSALMTRKQESRVGIILYAGDAYVFCPLTNDFSVISQFLQHIDADLVTARGSSLLRALTVTKKALIDAKSEQAHVVFLSDGEDLKDSAEKLTSTVKDFPGQILFLGVGSEEGVPIPLPQGGYLSANKEIVLTKMNPKDLSYVFSQSNSRFKKATLFDSDFDELLSAKSELDLTSDPVSKKSITTYGELGPFILIFTLALLLVCSWRRTALLVLLLSFSLTRTPLLYAQNTNPLNDSPAYEGYRAYQEGDFNKSYEDFSAALSNDPKNSRILNSLASAAFKAQKFAEAELFFNEAAKNAVLPSAQFDAHYGAGNAALAQKKYQAAIDAYNKALAITPEEARALHNSQIAKQLLIEEKKQQTPEPEKKDEKQEDKDKSEKEEKQSDNQQEQEPSSEKSEENNGQQTPGQATPAPSQTESGQDQSSDQEQNNEQEKQPDEQASPAPGDKAEPSAEPSPAAKPDSANQTESSESEQDQIPLSQKQAQEWLDSLPDTPLLLQRLNKRERINPGDQFW
jgi:Ca-activated chloride channel family protein